MPFRPSRLDRGAIALLAGALFAPFALVNAQQPTPLSALSSGAQGVIRATADSLRAEGLPGDAIIARAAEGLLKGADEPRVVLAVRRLAGELRAGSEALGRGASESELVAAATALHAGASSGMLRQLRAAVPRGGDSDRLTVPLVVLADLVSRGTPVRIAGESVLSLVSHHASDADLQSLRAGVERDILAGSEPGAAAVARSRTLTRDLGEGSAVRPPAAGPKAPPASRP